MGYNDDDDFLLLSGIQHFQFCRRQWALIHIEQQWEENVKTVEGQHLHRKADNPFIREKRGEKIVIRALPVKSNVLKITGICDVVELIKAPNGIEIEGEKGRFLVYPIEYKRGKPKTDDSDILQLVAQVICLEEMLVCKINKGYIYYHEVKHRVEIQITDEYRKKVQSLVMEMHDYYKKRYTPKVKIGKFCNNCSLQNICLPTLMSKQTVKSYIDRMIK
ncbi:CRISPR-associated protein Cas4 [Bacillus kwashiorkori]|uniref:CRISPR-associated protein Cas4 n=1 Tax=Bacillus kwashiorkori TaxID=1522318 RepID=UPI00078593C3|nr:CRISPR-associated protein Cas4 [Bacillus kwashiorkori]